MAPGRALFVHDPLWGDAGKGKVADYLATDEHIGAIFRYQGGNNAGHTVKAEGQTWKLHLIPTGILHEDKLCLLGNGMVIDPRVLTDEMAELSGRGLELQNLAISPAAHLIMPYHVQLDHLEELGRSADQSIGTTRRGIGPCYSDKVARLGIRIADALDLDHLRDRVKAALEPKRALLNDHPQDVLGSGLNVLDADQVARHVHDLVQPLQPHLRDVTRLLWETLDSGLDVLGEGAQGTLLDIDHGTYPFVTSSNCIPGAAAAGIGLSPRDIGTVYGVVKAYPTRIDTVGAFPSRMAETDPEIEELLIDRGREYGTTTGRRRRCGWNDVPALRYACRVSAINELVVTKMDVMFDIDLKLCVAYRLADGTVTDRYTPDHRILSSVEPVYEQFEGFTGDISGVREYSQLPAPARRYLERLEELVGLPVSMVGVGMDREQIIRR